MRGTSRVVIPCATVSFGVASTAQDRHATATETTAIRLARMEVKMFMVDGPVVSAFR
ncbi:MAG: hypothetical protein ACLQMT_01395 [Candidatus Acidiferrales bacterium]